MAAPATPETLAALAQQQQAAEAAAYEDQVAADADGGTDAALKALVGAALAGWVAAFGSATAVGAGAALVSFLARIRAEAARVTAGLGRRAARVVEDALAGAAALGARHVAAFGRRAGGRALGRIPGVLVPGDAVEAARAIAATVREQLALMEDLLTPGRVGGLGWRGVLLGLAAGRRAVGMVRRAVAWAVHRAVNDGAAQAIRESGARRLWVAEADACVVCTAYAGRLADADGMFPGGLSLDPQQRRSGAARIQGPPKHPSCRCKLVPWRDEWADGRAPLPVLLRERALRAAAAGTARPSESRASRLRAARTVITLPDTPPAIRLRARSAVAAGHF
jgi:hypothetical protein